MKNLMHKSNIGWKEQLLRQRGLLLFLVTLAPSLISALMSGYKESTELLITVIRDFSSTFHRLIHRCLLISLVWSFHILSKPDS